MRNIRDSYYPYYNSSDENPNLGSYRVSVHEGERDHHHYHHEPLASPPAYLTDQNPAVSGVVTSSNAIPRTVPIRPDARSAIDSSIRVISALNSVNPRVLYVGSMVFLQIIPSYISRSFFLKFKKPIDMVENAELRIYCYSFTSKEEPITNKCDWPPALRLRVNGRPLEKKWNSLTTCLRLNNYLHANWEMDNIVEFYPGFNPSSKHKYFVLVGRVVRSLADHELVERVRMTQTRPYDFCVSDLKDTFRSVDVDGDKSADIDDILDVSSRVSLLCPLGLTIMKTPVRSISCAHVQCFDLANFLQMHKQRSIWKCPVCMQGVSISDIVVDSFIDRILQQRSFDGRNEEEVFVWQDARWKFVELSTTQGYVASQEHDDGDRGCDGNENDGESIESMRAFPEMQKVVHEPPPILALPAKKKVRVGTADNPIEL